MKSIIATFARKVLAIHSHGYASAQEMVTWFVIFIILLFVAAFWVLAFWLLV